jgi:hypothetical protein
MMSSVHSFVARSQLNLYFSPTESMYPSECFTRPPPIKVQREDVWVVEDIVNNKEKNQHHLFLVHWGGYQEHKATWEPPTHLARSQELVKEYWYQEHDSEVPFKFPVMARKSTSHFVAQLPVMILIDSELDPVDF